MNALKHSFKKRERLKSRKEIASVFSAGKSISKGVVRFIYNTEQKDSTEAKPLLKTALAVPKKKIKKRLIIAQKVIIKNQTDTKYLKSEF